MTSGLVVGVDAGGTSTRCVVATLRGEARGYGRAGGANQNSSADPAAALHTALASALVDVRRERVVGGVVGIAGATARPEATTALVHQAWSRAGLSGTPEVTDDIAVAFAAGSAAAAGSVLIAGTGAVAARVDDGVVQRRADGHGWLLGDAGSGVWLALAGLRAALAALDGRGPATALTDSLALALDVEPGAAQPLRAAVYAHAPAELGGLAPRVTAAAGTGDAVAQRIVEHGAHDLVRTLRAVHPEPAQPIVFAGSVLATEPLRTLVLDAVAEPDAVGAGGTPVWAGPGELGAAGLALRHRGGADAHARLLHGTAWAKTS